MTYCEKCKSTNVIESENGNYCCNCGWDSTKKEYVKKQTNADKIRSMNDEELAEFINGFSTICELCNLHAGCYNVENTKCKNGILDWLQSEAE